MGKELRPLYGYFRLRHFPCDRPLLLHVCRGFYRKTVSKKTFQNDLIFLPRPQNWHFISIFLFFLIYVLNIYFFLSSEIRCRKMHRYMFPDTVLYYLGSQFWKVFILHIDQLKMQSDCLRHSFLYNSRWKGKNVDIDRKLRLCIKTNIDSINVTLEIDVRQTYQSYLVNNIIS